MTRLLAPASTRPDEPGVPTLPREVLSFRLGAEEYGIDILKVQEIRSYEAPTRIANAPAFISGRKVSSLVARAPLSSANA